MKLGQLIMAAAVAAVVAVLALHLVGLKPTQSTGPTQVTQETAYDRVMRTGTIRCGYFLYPKFLEKDVNTGKFSGIYYELMEEIGRRLSLKIDWAEEAAFATIFDGLKIGRYDVVCGPLNQTPGRARVTEFTAPLIFGPYFLYAKSDDNRFDNNYAAVNDVAIKVAIREGELSQDVRNEEFPKSQMISMPDITDVSQVLMQVAMGKADVAMTEPSSADPFLVQNPGKLKRVAGPSLRMQPAGLDVNVGEHSLVNLLNTAIQALTLTGFIERTVNKYVTAPDQLFFPAPTWGASAKPVLRSNQ